MPLFRALAKNMAPMTNADKSPTNRLTLFPIYLSLFIVSTLWSYPFLLTIHGWCKLIFSSLHRVVGTTCKATQRYIGKDGHGHADTDTDRRTRKTDSYGKDGHSWKRRTVMEKTGTYGKDGHLWKRRALLEKTGTYGKDGHLWKRRALMEKTDMCVYILN